CALPILLEDKVDEKYYLSDEKVEKLTLDFSLTSQDRHGVAIREATKQGYALAEQGDSVNYTYPTSKTRRGRVGKQVAQTLQAGEVNQGVVIDDTQGYDGVRYYKGIAPTLRSSRSGLKTIVTPKGESGEVNQGVVIGVGHHPFSKKREFNGYGLICPTLLAGDYKAPKTVLTKNSRIRKL